MSAIEAKLEAMGLSLPAPFKPPAGVVLPFSWVRVRGDRAYVSGHIALTPDGSIAEPLGKLGRELTLDRATPQPARRRSRSSAACSASSAISSASRHGCARSAW